MKIVIGCVAAAAAVIACDPSHAQDATWHRSKMSQGYYAAYVTNRAGATFRVDCGASADGAKTEVQSITYLPNRGIPSGRATDGAITIDGKRFAGKFQVQRSEGDPVEIRLGWDDMDSLELLKDIVARIRNGHSLTITLTQARARDSFGLRAAAQALGECQ